MTKRILITGGTGTLGREVVRALGNMQGREVATLSRGEAPPGSHILHFRADLLTGAGLELALDNVDFVVHCAGAASGDEIIAQKLVQAALAGSRPHILMVSVIGADVVPQRSRFDRAAFGYFGAKAAAERIIAGSGLRWSIVRASQFHQILLTLLAALSKLPVVPVPAGFRFQPVDAGDVATFLAGYVQSEATGMLPGIAGPRVYPMRDLVRSYLLYRGLRRPILQLPVFGAAASAFRSGANLDEARAVGTVTWEDALHGRYEP